MGGEHGDSDTGESGATDPRVVREDPYPRYLAFVAVTTTLGCTLLSAVLSPAFAWRENALSNLGVTWTEAGTTTTAVLFNGGLITGGLLGLVVALALYRRVTGRGDRVVTALCGVSLALMGLVGVFPQGTVTHFPVAIGFFLSVSVTLWVDGSLGYRAGERRRGLLTVAGGTANILAWVLWFALARNPTEGLALPEVTGAVIFGVWLLVAAVRLSRR